MSRDVPGLLGIFWTWDFGSHVWKDIPGCPEYSQDFLGLWQSCLVGHPGMSLVVPGLLGIFGRGTLVVMSGRTSRDVPSCPRTSWDLWTWDFGSHVW